MALENMFGGPVRVENALKHFNLNLNLNLLRISPKDLLTCNVLDNSPTGS